MHHLVCYRLRLGSVCCLVALLAPTGLRATPAFLPEVIDGWIEQLSDRARTAEAMKSLRAAGTRALGPLQQASRHHPSILVRQRALVLIRTIEREQKLVIGIERGYWLNCVAFTPDGKHAVATGGAVILYDLETGKEVRRSLELSFARPGLVLTRDGKHFVTSHQNDRVVRMGEVETGKVVRTFTGHTAGVHAVALSPDGKLLATGSNDKTLRLWNVETGKELKRFPGVTDMALSVAFSPDGRRLASGHYGAGSTFAVRLWDVEGGKEVRSLKGHTKDVCAVLFALDGKAVLSAGMDGAVILWDADSGKEIRRMTHPGGVHGAAVSPDGKRALTAGFGDKCVRLWDLGTGKELRCFEGHAGAALGVAFSQDARRAISCDSQCTLRLWKLPE